GNNIVAGVLPQAEAVKMACGVWTGARGGTTERTIRCNRCDRQPNEIATPVNCNVSRGRILGRRLCKVQTCNVASKGCKHIVRLAIDSNVESIAEHRVVLAGWDIRYGV